jgi:hypothetical protein
MQPTAGRRMKKVKDDLRIMKEKMLASASGG